MLKRSLYRTNVSAAPLVRCCAVLLNVPLPALESLFTPQGKKITPLKCNCAIFLTVKDDQPEPMCVSSPGEFSKAMLKFYLSINNL